MPYLYKLYHIIEFDINIYIYEYTYIYIYITSSKQALNDKEDGLKRLFRSGHSMNIYLFFFFYFLQIPNILPFHLMDLN